MSHEDCHEADLEEKLRPHRISAKNSLDEYLKNNYVKIGHIVHIIRAIKKD